MIIYIYTTNLQVGGRVLPQGMGKGVVAATTLCTAYSDFPA